MSIYGRVMRDYDRAFRKGDRLLAWGWVVAIGICVTCLVYAAVWQ